ncbi:TlpA disulfide reductase family protein [Aquimarina brevivitae]|uniref:Thiol-disulfide isomerase/thioredoxin n=1 Tax=Aquimarina brevivitae TaxID=323412 RepID=A0A4Q7PJF0_9FLAO|nr:TlpA disulfide reductase family protein [Aquimarina brevivitae]RZT00179.1 thiol-disulfide isomerase/thioredoxin [Aquimarina brevivitae]
MTGYRILYVALSLVFCLSCKEEKKNTLTATEVYRNNGIEIPAYDFDGFQPLLNIKDGKVRVINFWATWCKPCVAELPYFEMINKRYPKDQVEVILVSLDLPSNVDGKLIPFVRNQNLESRVLLLDDPDANSWIPKIDKEWSGAIPATIIYKDNKSKFYERSFTYNELEKELSKFDL